MAVRFTLCVRYTLCAHCISYRYLWTNDLHCPVRNAFDAGNFLKGQVGGGWAPLEIETFLGPVKWQWCCAVKGQGHLHPPHKASGTDASQLGIEPGTSCTAGEHFVQRAIRTALLIAIRNLGLYYYTTPFKSKTMTNRYNKIPARIRHGLAPWNSSEYFVPYWLLYFFEAFHRGIFTILVTSSSIVVL
jgi:hypothetical protein